MYIVHYLIVRMGGNCNSVTSRESMSVHKCIAIQFCTDILYVYNFPIEKIP